MHNITLCWSPLWQHGWSGIYHRLVSPIPYYGYILHILFLCSYMAKTIFGCFFSPWGHLIDLIGSAEEFPLFTTQDNLCKNASKHAHNCTFLVTNIRNLTTKYDQIYSLSIICSYQSDLCKGMICQTKWISNTSYYIAVVNTLALVTSSHD